MIKVIAIGRLKEKPMQIMFSEYNKRIKKYHPIELIELPNSKYKDSIVKSIKDESHRILEKIKKTDYVILLDIDGKNLKSEAISELIQNNLSRSMDVTFVIGGSNGVSKEVKERAQTRWSFSHLTFPHQLMRIMLYEQIYRAWMISLNHPYHK